MFAVPVVPVAPGGVLGFNVFDQLVPVAQLPSPAVPVHVALDAKAKFPVSKTSKSPALAVFIDFMWWLSLTF